MRTPTRWSRPAQRLVALFLCSSHVRTQVVWLDGSCGRRSPFSWLNSSKGTAYPPNVVFVSEGMRLCVVAAAALGEGDELLADYRFSS
jgi:hypothetical protein